MADDGATGASGSTATDSESTSIEINIKTLESQVHKLRVQKSETVLNLKEKIVDVAGIPVDQQRLIFRGRVLKDDHLLSEYHLEDGYTLHLVARRAAEGQPSSGTSEENTQANVNAVENGAMLGDYMSREIIDDMLSEDTIVDLARVYALF
jgi:ubiquitin